MKQREGRKRLTEVAKEREEGGRSGNHVYRVRSRRLENQKNGKDLANGRDKPTVHRTPDATSVHTSTPDMLNAPLVCLWQCESKYPRYYDNRSKAEKKLVPSKWGRPGHPRLWNVLYKPVYNVAMQAGVRCGCSIFERGVQLRSTTKGGSRGGQLWVQC